MIKFKLLYIYIKPILTQNPFTRQIVFTYFSNIGYCIFFYSLIIK